VSMYVDPDKVLEHRDQIVTQLAKLTKAIADVVPWDKMGTRLKIEFGNSCALMFKIVKEKEDGQS
jgi:hypothetical protein